MKDIVSSSRPVGVMPISKYTCALALAVTIGSLGWPGETPARQNSVNGGLSVGNDYDSNVFKSDTDREDEWKSQLAPQLSFSSKGLTDAFSLTYAPQFTYNHRRQDDEMSQALSFVADKGMSSRWKVTMSGNYSSYDNLFFEPVIGGGVLNTTRNFLRADSATQAEIVRILFPELVWDPAIHTGFVISQLQVRYAAAPSVQSQVDRLLTQGADGSRQRYWTSAMGVSSSYEFAEKSAITLGYRFASQDNQTGLLADHLEQTPSLLVTYQLNQRWRGEVGYELRSTTYDRVEGAASSTTSEDSVANSPHLQIDFQVSPANLLFWNYKYQLITFDGVQSDSTNQGTHLGWRHGLDPRTDLTTTLGTSYLSHEVGFDEREYSLDLGLSRAFDRGTIAVNGTGRTAVANTVGSWEKSRRSWEFGSNVAYQLSQDLASTGRLSYGQWDTWGIGFTGADSNYDRFQLGAGLSYGFKRWFTLSLNYDYNLFDTESAILDDYTEHLITIRLSAAKELWRW